MPIISPTGTDLFLVGEAREFFHYRSVSSTVIPEPSALLIWSILGAMVVMGRRR